MSSGGQHTAVLTECGCMEGLAKLDLFVDIKAECGLWTGRDFIQPALASDN